MEGDKYDGAIQGRAHCRAAVKCSGCKCSKIKSVFRRYRLCMRMCRAVLKADNKIISDQDRSDSAPCAGVNSMVKLLRAHGGCLGRDRR